MSLKMKLTSTICAFFLILGLVIMGVFAAPQASVNLGGTITFKATDVYANVYGSITGAVESDAEENDVKSLETLHFEAGEPTNTSSWENVPLTFNDMGGMITISITIENLATDRPLYASINDNYGTVTNVTKAMKKGEATYTGDCLTIPQKSGDDTNKVTINLTMEVDNPNFSLADGLRYGYLVNLSNTTPVVTSNDKSLGTVAESVVDGVLSVEVQPQEGAQFVGFRKTASGTLQTSATSSEQEFLNLNVMESGAFQLPYVASNMLGFDETLAKNLMSSIADNIFMDYSVYLNCPELVECIKDCYEQLQSDQMIQEEFIDTNELFGPMPGLNDAIVTLATGKISYSLDYTEGDKYQAVFIGQSEVKTENGYTYEAFSDAGFSVIKKFDLPDGQSTDVTLASTLGGLKVLGVATDFVAFLEDDYYYYVSPFTDKCTSIIFPDTYTVYAEGLCDSLALLDSVKIGSGATSIPVVAFECCSSLTSIEIPNSVTSIGTWALSYCDILESIDLPSSLISLGYGVFRESSNLGNITIPEGVTSIGSQAFFDCSSLESIIIPEGVTSIGDSTFYNCSGLTSIVIPEGVTSIGDSAFEDCSGLTSIVIPEGVTSIRNQTFRGCSGLTSIVIPEGVTSIGDSAFSGCGSLINISVPDSVTSIASSAFDNCSSLTYNEYDNGYYLGNNDNLCVVLMSSKDRSITTCEINSKTKIIFPSAFSGCRNLTGSIEIPEGVTSIGNNTFFDCSRLTSITIPSTVTSIGDWAFYKCSSLTSVTIGSGVTSIGEYAFFECSGLASITFDENSQLTSIGDWAFCKCSSLTSIVIPEGVTSIGNSAFQSCSKLTNITIPNSVTSIGGSVFQDCSALECNVYDNAKYLGNSNNPYLCLIRANDKEISTCNIHGDTKFILTNAFAGCNKLTSITIPNSVISIGVSAFNSCNRLASITISNSLTSIADSVFAACTSLASITIPGSVTSIGDGAFSDCRALTELVIPSSVTSIGENVFNGCSGLESIIVDENNAVYTSRDNNGNECNAIIKISNNQLIYGCKNTIIPSTVTSIGREAFSDCSELTELVIPSSVTSIGVLAFYRCTALTNIVISENVKSIDHNAFYGCTNLTTVIIDSKKVASGLTGPGNNSSAPAMGGLGNASYRTKLYFNEDIWTNDSEFALPSYVTTNFTLAESSDREGYRMYIKK